MSDQEEYGVLAHCFEKSTSKRICFHLQEYMGRQFMSIREFYLDRTSGDWKPSRSGVTIAPELYAELLQGVVALGDLIGVDSDPI